MIGIQRRRFALLVLTMSTSSLLGCGKDKPAPDAKAAEVSEAKLAELTKATDLEKTELKLGFIKLTDCAPLIIAKENGYFEEEGLNVTLEAQANWKVLLDR